MIIVVAGAAYSGRRTLAEMLLSELPGAKVLRTATTLRDVDSDSCIEYEVITNQTFDELESGGDIVAKSEYDEERYGIKRSDLDTAVASNGLYIAVCDVTCAIEVGHYLSKQNAAAVCIYLHCTARELLLRLSAADSRYRSDRHLNYSALLDIYANHDILFSQMMIEAEQHAGYSKVVAVNTSRTSLEDYPEQVLKPLSALISTL